MNTTLQRLWKRNLTGYWSAEIRLRIVNRAEILYEIRVRALGRHRDEREREREVFIEKGRLKV